MADSSNISDPRIGPTVAVPENATTEILDLAAPDDGREICVQCFPVIDAATLVGIRSLNAKGEIEIVRMTVVDNAPSHAFDVGECAIVGPSRECWSAPLGIIHRTLPLSIVFRSLSKGARLKLIIFWVPMKDPMSVAHGLVGNAIVEQQSEQWWREGPPDIPEDATSETFDIGDIHRAMRVLLEQSPMNITLMDWYPDDMTQNEALDLQSRWIEWASIVMKFSKQARQTDVTHSGEGDT